MSSQSLVCVVIFIVFMLPSPSLSDGIQWRHPTVDFDIGGYNPTFRAGDIVTIKVDITIGFKPEKDKKYFRPDVLINDIPGNSGFITGLDYQFGPDTKKWRIVFIPIMAGNFHVLFSQERFKIYDATTYRVTPGPIYEPGSIVSWMDPNQMNSFVAGTKAKVLILPKDAFGNNVTSESEGKKGYDFVLSVTNENGTNVKLQDLSYKGWNEFGYLFIEFTVLTAGNLSVHVKHKDRPLINSPLNLIVHPEALDVENCYPHWNQLLNNFQVFSRMEFFVDQRDKFGNLIPGLYDFDIELRKKGALSDSPIIELQYKEVYPGIQSVSFKLVEPGEFSLMLSNMSERKMIMDVPYIFNIYVGYCCSGTSYITGPGLNDTRAGEVAKISVILKDCYSNPAIIELEKLEVQIIEPRLSLRIHPEIYVKDSVNGTPPTGMLGYDAWDPTGSSVYSHKNSIGNSKTMSNEFEVVFTPIKSGVYEIYTYCGNIILNASDPFLKLVTPGEVNVSISEVKQFPKKIPTYIINDIVVRLVDSYYNPVLSQETRLKIVKLSGYKILPCLFVDNKDGTYTGCLMTTNRGKLELCISHDGNRLSPCPFGTDAIDGNYNPTVRGDEVKCWEEQSTSFNVLANDIIRGKTPKMTEFQTASHGSVLQYGSLLRYTPYKGFYGNDEFRYSILDEWGTNASAIVNVDVQTIPPGFISSPKQLQGTEDTLSPTFGGFPGFEIAYSDAFENISAKISAKKGTIFLSPISTQLWDPMWNELSVNKTEGKEEYLYLTGRLEVINFALNSLQYTGDENFSGEDSITIATINQNGRKVLDVKIMVEPINDPPFINVPEFILLDNEKVHEGLLIFDRKRDTFNFSIGDPDYLDFPGNKTNFQVMFSVEVSSGTLSAILPAELLSTTELKLKGSKQWQPLPTYVAISRQFSVNKARGIRFLGTLDDCNSLLHQLFYNGDENGGALKVSVNDMGWYGCYPNCTELRSVPLISEATINLITRTPMSPLVAHSLGSGIVIESILISSLVVTLMCFICKCVVVLLLVKKDRQVQSYNELQNDHDKMSRTNSLENVSQLTDTYPSPITQSGQPPDFRTHKLHQESGFKQNI